MSIIFYNKITVSSEEPCIRYNDRGFTLGHGLFETILAKHGVCPALDYHWKRLVSSASILGITLPFSCEELESMLTELIIRNNLQDKLASARVTITHGEAARGLVPAIAPNPNFVIAVFESAPHSDKPFSACIVNTRKNEHTAASRVKTISYMDNILAKQEAMSQGYDEAILLNTASNVADGSISNIFMVKDHQIFTPPVTDGALPGVVRAILLEEFSNKFSITEKSISPVELIQADELFLTNALMGIKSVHRLDNTDFSSSSITHKLSDLLRDRKNYI